MSGTRDDSHATASEADNLVPDSDEYVRGLLDAYDASQTRSGTAPQLL